MPHVSITVNGRDYRITCGEGEEAHVIELAGLLDTKVRGLTSRLGHISEGMALVMAGLTLADELAEHRRDLEALRAQMGTLDSAAAQAAAQAAQEAKARERDQAAAEQQAAEAIVSMAARIEALAERLDQA